MPTIFPHLWFARDAEAAIRFYVSLLPGSRIDRTDAMPAESPSGPAGSVKLFDFTLAGQRYQAIEAGPFEPFNHAISLVIECEDQAEVDRIWDAILAESGAPERCGWIRDRWGLSWQIVPRALQAMIGKGGPGAARAAAAMMTMVKLDVAALEAAFEGE